MSALTDAIDELRGLCEADSFPVLSDDRLTKILSGYMRAQLWTPNLSLSNGQKVLPASASVSAAGGSLFLVVTGGVTGATEPPWSVAAPYTSIASGTATLKYLSAWDGNLYDVRSAARQAWITKRGIISGLLSVKDRDVSINYDEIFQRCSDQIAQYQVVFLG